MNFTNIQKLITGHFLAAIISYFVARGLDSLFFEKSRDIKQAISIVTIDRPGTGFDVTVYYLFTATIVCFVVFKIHGKKEGQNKSKDNEIHWLKVLLPPIIIVFFSLIFSPVVLYSKVDPRMTVSGEVNHANGHYYLFVRPVQMNSCWLQEPTPLIPNQAGKWSAGANFGGGEGQRFELVVIASKIPLHPDIFNTPGEYLCSQIPSDSDRFIRVVTLR